MSQVTTAPARPIKKPAQKPCPDLPSFYRLLRKHRNDLKGRWIEDELGRLRFLQGRGKWGEEVICPLGLLYLVLSRKMECFQTAAEKLGLSDNHWRKIVWVADNTPSFSNRAIKQWLFWATGLSKKQPATAK